MPTRREALTGLAALGAGTLAAPHVARAQGAAITFKLPVEYSLDITPGLANQEFAKRIAERSGGRMKAELYGGGSLYKGLDLLQAVVRGDAEMTTLVSAYWAGVSARLTVFDLPYAFPTHESFYRAADDEAFMADVFSEMEAKGVKVLALLPYDYLVPGNRLRALVKPEDFKGLKLRALGRVNAAALGALGATAVPINVTEVSTALQQGVIDGLNTPIDAYITYRWHESIKHLTYAKYYFAFYPWTVNLKFWNSLAPDDQRLLREVVRETAVNHRPRARQGAADALAEIKAKGVAVHEQTPDEAAVWRAAMAKAWTDAEAQFGKPLVDRLRGFGAAA